MKTMAELRKVKERAIKEMSVKTKDGKRIVVGMATCGMAAGARPVMDTLISELEKHEVKDVSVTITGCIGVCKFEPLIDVVDSHGHKVTYVHMDEEKARRVVSEHIIGGEVCSDLTMEAAEAEAENA